MKAVILAGGLGTRISEESGSKPKPMIEIGNKPILWHIMKLFSHYGINEFIVCCGYKGYVIKEYFANYFLHTSDVTIDLRNNSMEVHQKYAEPWRVSLIDTGELSGTGGRLKMIAPYLDNEDFCMTYGDGLGSINIAQLINFHKNHGRKATVTAVQQPGRFGALSMVGLEVKSFVEKPENESGRINGGFFILKPSVLDYVSHLGEFWEREPLGKLAQDGELMAYQHNGFWQPMDTLRDKNYLEELWLSNNAPWKVWD